MCIVIKLVMPKLFEQGPTTPNLESKTYGTRHKLARAYLSLRPTYRGFDFVVVISIRERGARIGKMELGQL